MAIAFGNVTSSPKSNTGSGTLAAPTVSGSDTFMLLACITNTAGARTFSAVTYNGADISGNELVAQFVDYSDMHVWYVKNPASAANFAVTFTGGTYDFVLIAAYWTGVHQTTSYRTVSTATDPAAGVSPATVDVTNSASGDVIAGFFGLNDRSVADGFTEARVGGGQTFRVQVDESSAAQGALCDEPGASGTVAHSWAYATDVGAGWVICAVPMIPAAGGRAWILGRP